MTNLNNLILEKHINKKNMPILIEFWADWCGSCKIYNKIIDNIKLIFKKKIKIIRINNEFNNYICELFSIKNIPTTIIIKNKIIIFKKQGFINKEYIKNIIKNIINERY